MGRLDPEQRAAARARGPLLIVAGPGTGKTFTLTHRLALQVAGGADPESCLAITFTRRAAEEMRQRLAELLPDAARVPVFTFHGLGYAILREQRERLGFVDDVRIADERAQRGVVGELFGLAPRDLRRRLDDFAAARRRGDPADKLDGDLARELERYRAAMRARGLVDFDDLLALPVAILAADDALRDAYRARWRRLAIDEYQDVDSLQYRLVRLLAPAAGEVCAIGDPDQSIYGFRGADVGCFLRFRDDFPGARVIELGRNYRSRRPIVDAARQAIAPASLVPGRRLEAMAGDGERIVLHQAASARAEADFVARTIEELLGGASHYAVDSGRVRHEQALRDVELSFGDFAVLYRTRAQGRPFAEALARAGLPCQERSHQRLLERDDVRLLLHELERSAPAAPTPLRARLDALRERGVGGLEPAELDAAHELLTPLAERCGDDPDDFRARLALGAEVDLWDPRAERISLLTLHAAKGLEFPVVFLAGCDDGLLPLTWSGARDGDGCDPAEERRLFFVGITRARERLFLTRAHHRAFHGEPRLTRPSPFLAAIGPALLRRRDAGRPPRARQLRLL